MLVGFSYINCFQWMFLSCWSDNKFGFLEKCMSRLWFFSVLGLTSIFSYNLRLENSVFYHYLNVPYKFGIQRFYLWLRIDRPSTYIFNEVSLSTTNSHTLSFLFYFIQISVNYKIIFAHADSIKMQMWPQVCTAQFL